MDSITVSYDRNKVLGVGISAQVYAGQFNGEEVAVKRILKRTDSDSDQDVQNREEQTMKNLNHENVLKLIDVQQDMDFKYLILELCTATVKDYIKGNYKEEMPTEIDALIQMGSGLAYIHSQCLVHRDIKPANVLISQSFVLKISDFGVCRPVSGSGSFSMTSGPKGTRIYYSPEFIELEGKTREDKEKIRANVTIDIFSLGCLYFSYLTKGCHPFAKDGGYPDEFVTISNIQSDTKVLDNGKLSPNHYAFAVIDGMTKRNPNERLKLVEVLKILNNEKEKKL